MNQWISSQRAFRTAAMVAVVIGMTAASPQASIAQAPEETASPMAGMFSAFNPANWHMPDFKGMLPGSEEKARIKNKKDGLFTEVKQTASSSWTKTKEVLNPAKLNPVNYFPASSRTPSDPSEEAKPGFFRSLFMAPPAEEEQTETVQDFLKQSRPN